MLIADNPSQNRQTSTTIISIPRSQKWSEGDRQLIRNKTINRQPSHKNPNHPTLTSSQINPLSHPRIFDDIQRLDSGITLTPSSPLNGQKEGSDRLLTAGKILDSKLNAELVVISACNTGRGKITGDGVIGLYRSWISAGVPDVLVSLWAVPDASTAQLMTQFYQNLQKNPDKAQALRQAMLKIMKQYPNPRDWAAFTLIGEVE